LGPVLHLMEDLLTTNETNYLWLSQHVDGGM
jgi:hypothetical protein